jgi:hypothetical protein
VLQAPPVDFDSFIVLIIQDSDTSKRAMMG